MTSRLTVCQPTDPVLRQVCQPVALEELKNRHFQAFLDRLLNFVYDSSNKGSHLRRRRVMTVGLSANQVGTAQRICVVDLGVGHRTYNDLHLLINPELIWQSRSTIQKVEGCVNLPTIWGEVKRSKTVKIKALDRSGNELQIKATGWPAVLLQHEIDHLNGHLFIDHLPDPTKAQHVEADDYPAYKKSHKHWSKFIDVTKLTHPIEV